MQQNQMADLRKDNLPVVKYFLLLKLYNEVRVIHLQESPCKQFLAAILVFFKNLSGCTINYIITEKH